MINIGEHDYETVPATATLIAERYEDGIELRIENVHSNLSIPAKAVFVHIGPRGAVTSIPMSFTADEINKWYRRIDDDARWHIDNVERWRKSYFGALL